MKEIQLTQGKTTLVDDSDYEYLMQWKWCAAKSPVTWYAVSKIKGRLHKLLTGAARTDHKDRNGLNNQRENLRPATAGQNSANKKRAKNNTSGYKGVLWHPPTKKWLAQITVKGKRIHLGYFQRGAIIDAAIAYDGAAQSYFGEFALLNFYYDPACYI